MATAKTWALLGGIGVLALAAGWEFHAEFIVPLRQREGEALSELVALRAKVAGVHETISEMNAEEAAANRVRSELNRAQDGQPAGSAMVWMPGLLKDHFARSGISVPLIRLNTTRDEPELPGYEHDYWSVAMPIDGEGRNIAAMLVAVADLGQQNSFVRVLDFAIRPDPENPAGRVGLMNLGALVRK